MKAKKRKRIYDRMLEIEIKKLKKDYVKPRISDGE